MKYSIIIICLSFQTTTCSLDVRVDYWSKLLTNVITKMSYELLISFPDRAVSAHYTTRCHTAYTTDVGLVTLYRHQFVPNCVSCHVVTPSTSTWFEPASVSFLLCRVSSVCSPVDAATSVHRVPGATSPLVSALAWTATVASAVTNVRLDSTTSRTAIRATVTSRALRARSVIEDCVSATTLGSVLARLVLWIF